MTNFIHNYKKAYSKEYCNKLIELYDACEKNKFTHSRQEEYPNELEHIKQDKALYRNSLDIKYFEYFTEFEQVFWQLYTEYANKYSILKTFEPHKIRSTKIQKTNPGEGYHLWHSELTNRDSQARILTFILYLNDIEHGGETEFLYQGIRVKPEQGDLVLWPAYFTHTHRGNPPLKETKYILTGWVEF